MNPQEQFNEAIQAYQVGRFDEAELSLRSLVKEFPDFIDAYSVLGVVLMGKGQPAEALKSFQKAVNLNPERADIHYNIGNIHFQTGDFPAAVISYQLAIKHDPKLLSAHVNLGNVFLQTGDRIKAKEVYENVLSIQKDVLPALINLGHIFVDEGQFDTAEIHYQEAVNFHPENVDALLALGKYCLDTGSNEKAYNLLKTAAELDPTRTDTFVLLGNASKEKGLKEEAEDYYKRAIELEPDNQGAVQNLRRLYSNIIPKWHFTMLADEARNAAYDKAIKKAVNAESVVLDIGTGSGLLAMMAARAGAKSVVACEMHKKLAGVAKQVINDNQYESRIKVIAKKSTDLILGDDLPDPASVLISEILDVGAIGEGVVHVIRHASKNLLTKAAKIIPSGVKLFGQLVEIPARSMMSPVKNISGFNLSAFNIFRVPDTYTSVNLASEKHKILSKVQPLISYDFYNLPTAIQDNFPVTKEIIFPVIASGMLQAVAFWFSLQLDDDIIVSSKPGGDLQHWGQALFCFPNPESVARGDQKKIKLIHSDHIIRFSI